MLGDLLDLLAQRMVGWHFGVFGGHLSLPCLLSHRARQADTLSVMPSLALTKIKQLRRPYYTRP
jgi:hypothetical protein